MPPESSGSASFLEPKDVLRRAVPPDRFDSFPITNQGSHRRNAAHELEWQELKQLHDHGAFMEDHARPVANCQRGSAVKKPFTHTAKTPRRQATLIAAFAGLYGPPTFQTHGQTHPGQAWDKCSCEENLQPKSGCGDAFDNNYSINHGKSIGGYNGSINGSCNGSYNGSNIRHGSSRGSEGSKPASDLTPAAAPWAVARAGSPPTWSFMPPPSAPELGRRKSTTPPRNARQRPSTVPILNLSKVASIYEGVSGSLTTSRAARHRVIMKMTMNEEDCNPPATDRPSTSYTPPDPRASHPTSPPLHPPQPFSPCPTASPFQTPCQTSPFPSPPTSPPHLQSAPCGTPCKRNSPPASPKSPFPIVPLQVSQPVNSGALPFAAAVSESAANVPCLGPPGPMSSPRDGGGSHGNSRAHSRHNTPPPGQQEQAADMELVREEPAEAEVEHSLWEWGADEKQNSICHGLVTAAPPDRNHSMFVDIVGAPSVTAPSVDIREVAWHRRKFPQALPSKREEVAAVKQWVASQLQAISSPGRLHDPPASVKPQTVPSKQGSTNQPALPASSVARGSQRDVSPPTTVVVGRTATVVQMPHTASLEPVDDGIHVVTPVGSDGCLVLGFVETQEKVLSQGFVDLCRQVAVHCVGRGHLLEQLWEQMRTLLQATIADNMQARSMCSAATESEATKCNSLNEMITHLKDKVLFLEQGMQHLNRKVVQKTLDVDQWEKKYRALEARLQQEKHTAVQEATHTIQERLTTVEESNSQLTHQLAECQVQNKQLKTNFISVQHRLTAAETETEQMKERMGTMTPRPQRSLGILNDLLTPVEANNVQRLLVAGCSPEEVHRLLVGVTANDSDVSRVYHLLGCCKDHVVYEQKGRRKVPMSKENIMALLQDLISRGDVKGLATYLPDNVLDGVSQAVNNSVDPDSLVWLLYGTLQPNGFDVSAFSELGGVLARKYGHTKEEIGGPVTDTLRLAQMRTAEKMHQLEEKVKGLGREVQKLKRTIADAKKDKKPTRKGGDAKNKPQVTKLQQFIQTSWEEFFVGLGTTDDVPRAMQTTSNVTNWKIPKPDAEAQANELWEGKEEWEAENGGKITLQDYMYVHYYQKFKGNQKGIIENAYNLLYALSQHMYDADCNLFVRVFCEEFDEGVREVQDKIGDEVIDMLSEVDKNINQTVTGWLPKTEVKNALANFFKTKKPERLAEICDALDTDESGDVVNYAKLFEEDEDMNQGMFAEVCRTQVLTDRLESLQEIQDTLYDVCNTLSISTVEPTLLKDVLKKVNPYATQEEITEYLHRAFGQDLKKAKPVSVADAVLYIRRGFNKLPEPKKAKQKAGGKSITRVRSTLTDPTSGEGRRSRRETRDSMSGQVREGPLLGRTSAEPSQEFHSEHVKETAQRNSGTGGD